MVPFPPLKNDLLLRAARHEAVERVPVWIMRQAGRYLPEFLEVRKSADFFTMCRTPALAAEVTLQPIRRFALDGAIIFSDILVVPQALGMEVQMLTGSGPHFPKPLQSPSDIDLLNADVDVTKELGYVFEAITLTRQKLDGQVPLLGFCGAPWTLMAYMIEGGGSKSFSKSKAWLYKEKEASHRLLSILTEVSIRYLVGQVIAGAQMLQVFDSHAGELAPDVFEEFALPCLRRINEGVKTGLQSAGHDLVPMIVFAKGAHYALTQLSQIGYDVVGLDWTIPPGQARAQTAGAAVALQGNLDPCVLYASDDEIRQQVRRLLQEAGTQGWIANLGHGMNPDHNPDKVAVYLKAVAEISAEMIATSGTTIHHN